MNNLTTRLLFILMFSHAAMAGLDLQTQNVLITKIENIRAEQINDPTIDTTAITLRLADLYAERARLVSNDENGTGEVKNSAAILADRNQAIKLYTQSLKSLKKDKSGSILLQIAHLHSLNKKSQLAKVIYEQISKDKSFNKTLAQVHANIGLADFYFNSGNFESAQKYYVLAEKNEQHLKQDYIQHRLAWCAFNLGKTSLAINKITHLLENKSLDGATKEEASKDLATFLSRTDVTQQKIDMLKKLSPEKSLNNNLLYLAKELDRSGKKQQSLLVWSKIEKNKISSDDKIESQIDLARIQYEIGNKPKAAIEISKAIDMIVQLNQSTEETAFYKQNIRTIITQWGKAEELNPSKELIISYQSYVKSYSDIEINFWAGLAAERTKNYALAFDFYLNAAEIAALNSADSKKTKLQPIDLLESSLQSLINVAELSKNLELKDKAYSKYLILNPSGQKSAEIKYQLAQNYYEKKEYTKAAEIFHALALDSNVPSSLRNKSADLSLDCQNLLKNDLELEKMSYAYIKTFPKRAKEFIKIYQKAVINNAATVINDDTAEGSELKAQAVRLNSLKADANDNTDNLATLKSLIIIGHKTNDLFLIKQSAQKILALPNITKQQKTQAQKEIAWAQEMNFEFKNALNTLKNIQVSQSEKAEYTLRLALLSDLSNENPSQYYKMFIKLSNNQALKKHAEAQLNRFSNKKIELISEQQKLYKLFLANRINSLKTFKHDFDKKIKLLKKLETAVLKANESNDWTLKFITISHLADANHEIAKQILILPIPKNIPKQQIGEYKLQIKNQIMPYLVSSKELLAKAQELWGQVGNTQFAQLKQAKPENKILALEFEPVKKFAHRYKFNFSDLNNRMKQKSQALVESQALLQKIRRDPFNSNYLEQMKSLHTEIGNQEMVAYLDSRLLNLQNTRGQN